VLDEHPMVGQLMVFGQVESIENAFDARSIQRSIMLLRDRRAPTAIECEMKLGFDPDPHAAPPYEMRLSLILEFAVFDNGVVSNHKLSDGIREVGIWTGAT